MTEMNEILEIPGNRENVERLLANEGNIVPFVGSGFSMPACPGWSEFLEILYRDLKESKFLTDADSQKYQEIKISDRYYRLEEMADFLVQKAHGLKFEQVLKTSFEKSLPPSMTHKFDLFYKAFPGLKITTNFDTLIEAIRPAGENMVTFYGYQPDELNRMFTHIKDNCLLKIHGDIGNPHSIILTRKQYEDIYGDSDGFKIEAALPKFLERVFTNSSVLFIGCSLETDRTVMILRSLKDVRDHFAIMPLPKTEDKQIELNRRMSALRISPIWITNFDQIEIILKELALPRLELPHTIDHNVSVVFVGREKQMEQFEIEIQKGQDNFRMTKGMVFVIKGAGGIGKTTLAIEVANRFKNLIKNKEPKFFRPNDYTPMSFVTVLSRHLGIRVNEPQDKETAKRVLTRLLKDRELFIILDDAIDWKSLIYMIPEETYSIFIVTTRNREIFDKLRIGCKGLPVHEITLEKFTGPEVIELFKKMLGNKYNNEEESIYQEIAGNLGNLPIALMQAISLMLYGPHYTALQLRDKLKNEDRLELLQKGVVVDDSGCLPIEKVFDLSSELLTPELIEVIEILAICTPGLVPFSFLNEIKKRLTTFFDIDLEAAFEYLATLSWIDQRMMGEEKAFEMHQLVREMVIKKYGPRYKEVFVDTLHEICLDETAHFTVKDKLVPQLNGALEYMKIDRDSRMKSWVVDLAQFCMNRGYGHFYIRLTEVVEELFPKDRRLLGTALDICCSFLQNWGRLDEAMIFCRKEEKIYEKLEDWEELAMCYGTQASILHDWGKLDEAMTILKKEEKLCDELGERAELAVCYGNQAMIFNAWGKIDEAIVLLEKQKKICEKMSDKNGLILYYKNHALILEDLGQFEEALSYYKKEERVWEELGERDGLAECYGNQFQVLRTLGRIDEAISLQKKEEKVCEEIGDLNGLARTYSNHAQILFELGRLEEAMNLLKKQEKLCEDLEDKFELAGSYETLGLILKDLGDFDQALIYFKKQEKICYELDQRGELAECYGNQALIFQKLGKSDEVMPLLNNQKKICEELNEKHSFNEYYRNYAEILHDLGKFKEAMVFRKKEEALCKELDDRIGLAECYKNQALILQDMDRLDEVINLFKKAEKLWKELGKIADLAECYGNHGLILQELDRLDEAMTFHKKEEEIYEKLGDRDGLAVCYGNQALILQDMGRLDEAMELFKKEETLCQENKDREGLARTWWNQGNILNEQGDFEAQYNLWQKSIETDKSIGIPTEEQEKDLIKLMKQISGKKKNNRRK